MTTTRELRAQLRTLATWHAEQAKLGGPNENMHNQAELSLQLAACALPLPSNLPVRPVIRTSEDIANEMIAAAEQRRVERLRAARESTRGGRT